MQIQTGIVTISDRASKGLYDDLGGPALKRAAEGYGWPVIAETMVPDEKREIQRAGDALNHFRHEERVLLALNHARPGDEK